MKTLDRLGARVCRFAAGAGVAALALALTAAPPAVAQQGQLQASPGTTEVLKKQSKFIKVPGSPTGPIKLAIPLVEISVPVILENVHPDVNKAIVECWVNSSPNGLGNAMTKKVEVEVPLAKFGYFGSSCWNAAWFPTVGVP